MIDHVRIEAVMKKLKRSFTMRTVFLAVATVALLTSTAIFMSVGAAGEVTPSDLTADAPSAESGTESEAVVDEPSADEPEGSGEESEIPQGILTADASADFSIVSPTDTASVSRIVSPSEMLNLGAPVATMTTAAATGSTFSLDITGTDVYIDYGDGTTVPYPGDATVLGSEIKLYGNITGLHCESNQLTALDVSNNTALTNLDCESNQLTSLDVSGCAALTHLDCYSNQLTTLSVSGCTALTGLDCSVNQLTALDVSGCTALTGLYCSGNQLTSLNVSGCTALQRLNCWVNQLTTLDVSQNTALEGLVCGSNHLTMPTIYGFNAGRFTIGFLYAPQTHIIPSTVKAGESIDLSSEASVNGTATVFTWYDEEGNEVTPATSSGGVFTFGDDAVGKKLVCKMTNEKLPDFVEDNRLTTTVVTIEEAPVSSDPVSSENSDPVDPENSDPVAPVSSDDRGNGGVPPRTIYYDLPYEQNDEIDGFRAVQYPEGTIVEINGRKFDLHSIFGIRLNIGHIDKSQRKPILDAIKVYNKSFDPDTNNIIFYEMNLEDSNQAHVNIVKGHVLICMNYPENLPKQWNKYVFHLYHQRKDGSIEEIPVNCMANGIWCTATDFSPYVLCWDEAKIESAGTGESMVIINVMAILFFVSAMSMNLVLYRRRRLMRNL
ncbi:MAG: hypothetical protein IIZ08_03110 [Clostridia bacterium]|nr:hypothetical protein [Clostridia bacterium]